MKKWKLGAIIIGLTGLIHSLYSIIFVGEGPFIVFIFEIIFGFLPLMVGSVFEAGRYWKRGVIAGFLIPFIIFLLTSVNRDEQRLYTGMIFFFVSVLPAIVICTIIGYLIDRYKNSRNDRSMFKHR